MSLVESLAQVREAVAQSGRFTDDSTELIRETRRERSAQLLRAVGWDADESPDDE